MSSFIVDPITMNRIIAGFKEFGIKNFGTEPKTIWTSFYALNKNAVNYLYGEGESDQIPIFEEDFEEVEVTKIEFTKSLHSLVYQCYEGDNVTTALYIELERIFHKYEKILLNEFNAKRIDDIELYNEAYW